MLQTPSFRLRFLECFYHSLNTAGCIVFRLSLQFWGRGRRGWEGGKRGEREIGSFIIYSELWPNHFSLKYPDQKALQHTRTWNLVGFFFCLFVLFLFFFYCRRCCCICLFVNSIVAINKGNETNKLTSKSV